MLSGSLRANSIISDHMCLTINPTITDMPLRIIQYYFVFACWVIFSCFCCHLLTFQYLTFQKFLSFSNTIQVSNILDPDQDRPSAGPDLGPNCLQRLSVYNKSHSQDPAGIIHVII